MAWYNTGTVSVTNNSATVTGSGTAFVANVDIGEGFLAPNGRIYEVTNVTSDTEITISPAYNGSTAGAQAYSIVPIQGRIADLTAEAKSLLSSFATVRDGIGSGLFPDGTVSTPALRFSADQDTGVFRPSANTLGLVTGGTQRVHIDSDGRVGIGTDTPGAILDVRETGLTSQSKRVQANTDVSNFSNFLSTDPVLYIANASAGDCGIHFRANNSDYSIRATDSGELLFEDDATERLRIDSNGRVGIGTTVGFEGSLTMSDYALIRRNNDGWLLKHERTDNSQECGLKSVGHSGAVGLSFVTNDTERLRLELNGNFRPGTDNTQTLGAASFRWSTVYAGTGTINTSDEREKKWRGPLNAAELAAAKRIAAEIGIYQFLSAIEEKGEDGARLHCGVRAQRAFAILDDEGLDWRNYAWCCFDEWDQATDPGEGGRDVVIREAGDRYGVRTDQLVLWLIAAQEQRLLALEAAA